MNPLHVPGKSVIYVPQLYRVLVVDLATDLELLASMRILNHHEILSLGRGGA